MIRNAEDNCPFDANRSQEDSDADEAISVTSALISPIPGRLSAGANDVVSIEDIQSGRVAEESSVASAA